MRTTIQEHTGELIVLRCWCGIQHAVPKTLRDEQIRQHDRPGATMTVFCPLGHQHQPAGVSEAETLRQRLAREQSSHDRTRAELRDTEASRRAQKGATTRLRKRVASGVCPCCHRTFKQLARHMNAKHPEFEH